MLTVVLGVLLTIGTVVMSAVAPVLGMAADPCYDRDCDYGLMSLGLWWAILAPWLATITSWVVSILMLRRRRLAFWAPLLAAPVAYVLWMAGSWIIENGVPAAS